MSTISPPIESTTPAEPPRLFVAPELQLELELLPLKSTVLAGGPGENYLLAIVRSQATGGAVSQVTLNLGLMLENGEGIAKDIPAARNIFLKAANEGDTFAERKLAELDGNDAFQTAMLGKTSRIK